MARFQLALPPGVFRNGTEYQAKGRYYDASLVRWYGQALGPIGGWRRRGTGAVTGMARAAVAWRTNGGASWLGVGTHTGLWVANRLGATFDITPDGFTAGRADASASGGFGSGPFGSGTFGTPRPDATAVEDATQWSLDTWGEDLVGVSPDDRKIYLWELDTSAKAAQVENSPECDALVVTPERFLFALGTDDPRTVSWPDQENITVWNDLETNQAGSFPLQTAGRLMCGRNVKGGTLLFTDADLHLAVFGGGTFVWGFDKVGDACGAISRQAVATFDMQAAWMDPGCNFWLWNGYPQPIPCDVQDYVRKDINLLQASKIVATVNSQYSEVEWRYCSAGSTTIDRCVVWNWRTFEWNIGRARRTCGVDRGAFQYPILISGDGKLYDHEVANDYGGDVPFAVAGPIELGNGDQVINVLGLYPDDATLGDVTATFYARNNPDDAARTLGPFDLSSKTDLRFAARQVEVRFDGARNTNWRVGIPRLETRQGGFR